MSALFFIDCQSTRELRAGLQREVSIEGESDFCRERRMTGEESEEPAAGVSLGEEFGQGQVVIESYRRPRCQPLKMSRGF